MCNVKIYVIKRAHMCVCFKKKTRRVFLCVSVNVRSYVFDIKGYRNGQHKINLPTKPYEVKSSK